MCEPQDIKTTSFLLATSRNPMNDVLRGHPMKVIAIRPGTSVIVAYPILTTGGAFSGDYNLGALKTIAWDALRIPNRFEIAE